MAKNSKWGNIVFYKTKEGKLRWFDPDKAKTPEGKARIKAIRMGKQSKASQLLMKNVAKDIAVAKEKGSNGDWKKSSVTSETVKADRKYASLSPEAKERLERFRTWGTEHHFDYDGAKFKEKADGTIVVKTGNTTNTITPEDFEKADENIKSWMKVNNPTEFQNEKVSDISFDELYQGIKEGKDFSELVGDYLDSDPETSIANELMDRFPQLEKAGWDRWVYGEGHKKAIEKLNKLDGSPTKGVEKAKADRIASNRSANLPDDYDPETFDPGEGKRNLEAKKKREKAAKEINKEKDDFAASNELYKKIKGNKFANEYEAYGAIRDARQKGIITDDQSANLTGVVEKHFETDEDREAINRRDEENERERVLREQDKESRTNENWNDKDKKFLDYENTIRLNTHLEGDELRKVAKEHWENGTNVRDAIGKVRETPKKMSEKKDYELTAREKMNINRAKRKIALDKDKAAGNKDMEISDEVYKDARKRIQDYKTKGIGRPQQKDYEIVEKYNKAHNAKLFDSLGNKEMAKDIRDGKYDSANKRTIMENLQPMVDGRDKKKAKEAFFHKYPKNEDGSITADGHNYMRTSQVQEQIDRNPEKTKEILKNAAKVKAKFPSLSGERKERALRNLGLKKKYAANDKEYSLKSEEERAISNEARYSSYGSSKDISKADQNRYLKKSLVESRKKRTARNELERMNNNGPTERDLLNIKRVKGESRNFQVLKTHDRLEEDRIKKAKKNAKKAFKK